MALPLTRNRTYDPTTKVNPADLNDLQDSVIGGKHGDLVLAIPASAIVRFDAASDFHVDGYVVSTGAAAWAVPLPLFTGHTIKGVTFARYGNGAADIVSGEVYKMTAAGVQSALTAAGFSEVNPAAAWADTVVALSGGAYTLLAGEAAYVRLAANAAGIRLGNFRVTIAKV